MNIADFLNPRSMFTPGFAGGIIMLITNSLWVTFAIPQKWAALFLSALLVILTLKKYPVPLLEKAIYFIFNVLILFSLAVNTNFAGRFIVNPAYVANAIEVRQAGSLPVSATSSKLVIGYGSLIKDDRKEASVNYSGSNVDETQQHITSMPESYQYKLKNRRSFFDSWFQ
jgi:hypothetical protein